MADGVRSACSETSGTDHPLPRRAVLRAALRFGSVLAGGALVPAVAAAVPDGVETLLRKHYGDRPVEADGVTLTMPAFSENGSAVALEVVAASPMRTDSYVRSVHILAEKNPLPDVARFHFTPASGLARATTRVRLADSQWVVAVAELSDGSLQAAGAEVVVTLAACIDIP